MIDKSKYVVLDVETNGLTSKAYDLLSISIYKPDDNRFYDRFLPLELQKEVLTTSINGITKSMLKNKKPLSQKEFDSLLSEYELDKRVILTYGNLDKNFIKQYLIRHKIVGFEKLSFKNIKEDIISTAYTNGLLTKDNMCMALGISGVQSVHSGHNDCLLEWKLFEKMDGRKLFVSYHHEFCPSDVKHSSENWYIYELTKDYIVPVSYLHSHPKFKKILSLPKIDIEFKEVFKLTFSNKCSPEYSLQPAGIASEYLVKSMLGAKYENNYLFLLENKKKLKYLGSIIAENIETVLYEENEDGTLSAINKKDEKIIEAMNIQTLEIKKEIGPIIDYIQKNIFKNAPIHSQELIVNNEYKILGCCDFSNKYACLETKWHTVDKFDTRYYDEFKYQLYITSNGRPCFIMVGTGDSIIISNIIFKPENKQK